MPRSGKTEGEAVQESLLREHAERQAPGPKIPMPNGQRISALPYIGMRYQGMNNTLMLGDPAAILKDPRPGSKYVWKKRTDKQTAAWVRSGILRPVEPSEIDTTRPDAEYVEDQTGTQSYVQWESLTLFEMAAKWVKRIYTEPEDWALARLAQQSTQFRSDVEQVTGGVYTGDLSVKAR